MGVKLKVNGQWVDQYEAQTRAEPEPIPAPMVDVTTLPDLPPDTPLEKLGDLVPEVRRYITFTGQMRSGLTKAEQETAQAILKRYGA